MPAADRIQRVTADAADAVYQARELFDGPPDPAATARFLSQPGHHLLLAWAAGEPVGMVTGVEMTHPDKGTEMFLYELGVRPDARGAGVGKALVAELASIARSRGCYGMWTATDDDNLAALAVYQGTGALPDPGATRVLAWDLRLDDG